MDEPQQGGPGLVVDFAAGAGPKVSRFVPAVSFDRRELSTILNLYGRKVAVGDFSETTCSFFGSDVTITGTSSNDGSGTSG